MSISSIKRDTLTSSMAVSSGIDCTHFGMLVHLDTLWDEKLHFQLFKKEE